MKISVVKSGYFMNRARDSCLSPPLDTVDGKTETDNYFSPMFLDAYIMSVTALEAFINEQIAINIQIEAMRKSTKTADSAATNRLKILEMLKDQEL